MKIIDQQQWHAQQAEIASSDDAETGKTFLTFVEDWCDAAEAAMSYLGSVLTPIEALRAALEPIEDRHGHITGIWLNQMLLVIMSNWEHGGNEMFEAMTVFEQRAVADVAATMIAKQQESALGGGQ